MDAAWGGSDGLDACEQALYAGTGAPAALPAPDSGALLEKLARRALIDAGIPPGSTGKLRVALITAGARVSELSWPGMLLSGAVDLSLHENPLVGALEQAAYLLAEVSPRADAVVFASVGASSMRPAGQTGALAFNRAGLGFDRTTHSWRRGDGGGAVVLMNTRRAIEEGRRVYAILHSLAAHEGTLARLSLPQPPALDDVRACCRQALAEAGVSPEQVGYVEAFACGSDALDGIEIAGLVQAYRPAEQDFTAALGSVQTGAGYLGPAAGLAGLIHAALCLYQRILPGSQGWTGPKLPALWRGAPFYIPAESRPWFTPSDGAGRLAGLNLVGLGGACAHLLLAESQGRGFRPGQAYHPNRALAQCGFFLIPLAGDDLPGLLDRLIMLKQALAAAPDLSRLAAEAGDQAAGDQAAGCQAAGCQAAFALALVGHSAEELLREADLALKALPSAFEQRCEWQTPLGSYFTPEPVGRLGDVALVYPGAFSVYPGVGKDLFRLFPGLHPRADALTSDLGRVFRERMLFPRGLNPFTKEEIEAQEAQLLDDPIAMLISGTALSVLYTHILQETFAVRPAAAFGYSLGENSMIYASGVWYSQGDEAAARLETSPAFLTRLAGPKLAIREYWGLPPVPAEGEGSLWSNYLAMVSVEKARAAVEQEPRVFLTHINTPRQVVIGGEPQACLRVLAELKCSSLKAPFDYALHCDVMSSEYAELANLHRYPVENETPLCLYSAAGYAPLPLEQEAIAQKMAGMLTSPLDFPRLVRQVYADGARVFIEAGAASNCSRWIDETLKGSPHLALSMNRRGTDDTHTLVRMVARLFSHRVPLRLSALYQPTLEKVDV
jgi:PfaB family protein